MVLVLIQHNMIQNINMNPSINTQAVTGAQSPMHNIQPLSQQQLPPNSIYPNQMRNVHMGNVVHLQATPQNTPQQQQQQQQAPNRDWSSTMCSCAVDEETCWWGTWCCWMLSARTIESFDIYPSSVENIFFWCFIGSVLLVAAAGGLGLGIIYLLISNILYSWRKGSIRTKIREKLRIYGSDCDDWLMHFFCPCCSVCQEAREAKIAQVSLLDYCSGQLLSEPMEYYKQQLEMSSSNAISGDGSSEEEIEATRTFSYIPITASLLSNDSTSDGTVGSFKAHFYSLSKTSHIILTLSFVPFFIVVFVLTVVGQVLNALVLLLVFVQPALILYFVYWKERRQYVSLDYVIKIFAVGFWFSTFQSLVLEMFLQTIIVMIFAIFVGPVDSTSSSVMADHIVGVIIFVFLISFVVAAGVEETMKHFAVRCCRFPAPLQHPHAVLVYLMAAALGFATAENCEYVFGSVAGAGGSRFKQFAGELFILGIRLLLPIHVICSVLQAANLAKVLSGIKQMNLFQILLPAWLLHGAFDFVLFLLGALAVAYPNHETAYLALMIMMPAALTIGGVVAAVLMFNQTLKQYLDKELLVDGESGGNMEMTSIHFDEETV